MKRVLVMDDEEAVRRMTGKILMQAGYRVDLAGDGVEAIEVYKKAMESGNPFDGVILDLTVKGGMGGAEAMRRLFEIDPGIRAMISTGYCDDPILKNYRGYGFSGAMTKPFTVDELCRVIKEVIGGE